jgi:hypothetical protein
MAALDVMERLAEWQRHDPALRLYALVDGVQYRTHRGEPLEYDVGRVALFDGTPDAALAHAGPWLVDAELAGDATTQDLARLERQAPAVTWLIAQQDLRGLAQLLQLKLDTHLPDERSALLRFWDPRVLAGLAELLDAAQRETFFAHIHEWHLLHNQRRVWIGRQHAPAH